MLILFLCLTDAPWESNFFFVRTFPLRFTILLQLLGLKACHDRSITHRDIKPGKKLFDVNDSSYSVQSASDDSSHGN